ncbi:MAG: HDOD domain-containing protein [Chitinivibrionales bacterium]|nr:HDOD domain-containing protein [Chitinivibrionales bacterium]
MESALRTRMEKIIGRIDQLPTLPLVCRRLQAMLTDPTVSARDVGAVIEQDQALAAKLLKVVNSSYYHFPKKISTISHSVVILGFNEIKHMALSVSLLKMFGRKTGKNAFSQSELWKHSLGVAVCAGAIGRKVGQSKCPSHEEAFAAGLLHDIGKIIEDQFLHDDFVRVLTTRQNEKLRLVEAEKSVLRFTHQDIGAFLAEQWRIPPVLVSAIGFHHDPIMCRNSESIFTITSIVHCANVIVRSIALGSGGDPFVPHFVPESWYSLGMTIEHVQEIVDETCLLYDDMSNLLLGE